MTIHDQYGSQISELISKHGKEVDILDDTSWPMLENSDYILDSETYVELGTTSKESLSYTVCTANQTNKDSITLVGKDISILKGKVVNFAKIVIVDIKEDEDQNTIYRRIKECERVKHTLNYEGTMLRATSLEGRECFRISKQAYKKNLNFSILGSELIKKFKTYDFVKSVQVFYIVDNKSLIEELSTYPSKLNIITEAFNHIFDDIVLDCESCAIKEICDEVDGMRDAHKKMYGKK